MIMNIIKIMIIVLRLGNDKEVDILLLILLLFMLSSLFVFSCFGLLLFFAVTNIDVVVSKITAGSVVAVVIVDVDDNGNDDFVDDD